MAQTDKPPSKTTSDRTEAEAALRKSEERFRATFEQSAVGMAHVAPDGRFLRVNRKLCDIVGYTRDEMLARTFQQITHPDDLDSDRIDVDRLLSGEIDSYSKEKRYIHKNGKIVWVSITPTLLREDGGEPRWAVAVVQDITQRKTLEEALRRSEERYRGLFEAAFEAIFLSEKGVCLEQNAAAEEMFGYTSAEAVGRKGAEWIVPEDREMVTKHMLSGYEGPYEVTALRKDGSTFPAEIQARMMHYEGRTVRVTALADITEQKQSTVALRESERKHRTLLETLPQKIFLKDTNSAYTFCNENYARDLGIRSREIAGKTDFDFFPRELAEKYRADDKNLIEVGRTLEFDEKYVLNGKTTWVRTVKTPIRDDQRTVVGILGIFWDITEHKQAEIKIGEYQRRLKALASKLTVSEERERRRIALDLHDHVGQSLSFARVQLAAAIKGTTDTDLAAELNEISQSLLQAVQDTRDIMYDLSSPAIDEFGLDAAISEWMDDRIASRHGLKTELIADVMKTPLDDDTRVIIFRSVRELLTNVVKHAHATKVSVRMMAEADTLRVAVEDDGVGFRVPGAADADSGEGGFGLFSISERMSDLGGGLEIESEPGRGCRAVLVFPYPDRDPDTPEREA